MTAVRLHPLLCGEHPAPEAWFHGGPRHKALGIRLSREEWLRSPVVAFLAEHPERGPVLIDTGLHPSVAEQGVRPSFGPIAALAFRGMRTTPEQTVRAQLRARGVDPDAVRHVVMTHLHVDHASGMSEFPRATFTVDARELRAARGRAAGRRGYRAAQFDGVEHSPIDLRREGTPFGAFGHSLDLFGDGSLRLVATPGHTHGHLSVIVRVRGGEVVVAGDALYTERNLDGAVPFANADRDAYVRSVAALRAHADEHRPLAVVPGHDMEAWERLPEVF